MDGPLVSILMTVYNREHYISDAIESILSSTYKNFELIIVDDCSGDKSVEIANHYAGKDSRINVYRNEKNLGDYPNRNKAASYARGKYIKYVDADDYIYPTGLSMLVETMEKFPDAGWGLCSLDQDKLRPFPFALTPKEAYEYNYIGPGLFHKAPLSSIIKTDVFTEIGGFAPLRMVGDFEMWHRLAKKYKVVLMQGGIVWYRVHGDQEIKDFNKYLRLYERIKMDYLKSDDCPLTAEQVKHIRKENKRKILRSSLAFLLKFRIKHFVEFMRLLKFS